MSSERTDAWIQVHYCAAGAFGKSYGAGSTRMYANDLTAWIRSRTDKSPILITEITVLSGELKDV